MNVSGGSSKVDDETKLIASDVSEKTAVALEAARGAEMRFVAYLLTMALAEARELAGLSRDETSSDKHEDNQ